MKNININFLETDNSIDKMILDASITAVTIGSNENSVSGSNLLTEIQTKLVLKIASYYGFDISKEKVLALILSSASEYFGKRIYKKIVDLSPYNKINIAGTTAGAFTYTMGKLMKKHFKNKMKLLVSRSNNLYFLERKNKRQIGFIHE